MTSFFESFVDQGFGIFLLVVGFGFVIFWHELGHFLAAKWAGVRVEQFAVGFGQALLAWRKGIGLRVGTTAPIYAQRIREHLAARENDQRLLENRQNLDGLSDRQVDTAATELGLGETEYRLNWIPLGGYVKMLGQDDLRPNAVDSSPRAFNMKPVGKRMVIVSAGVIMNIILAMILFAILFRMGFKVPAPVVGGVIPLSPAQQAGLKVGDHVQTFDGQIQHDFNKIVLSVALARNDSHVPIVVRRPGVDGSSSEVKLDVRPTHSDRDAAGFLMMGIEPSPELRGPSGLKPKQLKQYEKTLALANPAARIVGIDEVIVAINGVPVPDATADNGKTQRPNNYHLLDRAIQESGGKPVVLTIRNPQGQDRFEQFTPEFRLPFDTDLSFAGLVAGATVDSFVEGSGAMGKLEFGDRIVSITIDGESPETVRHPSVPLARATLGSAGESGRSVTMEVLRKGELVTVKELTPNIKLDGNRRGLGISLGDDSLTPIVGEVRENSPAARAYIPAGAKILSVNGQTVATWFDIWNQLKTAEPGKPIAISYEPADSKGKVEAQLTLDKTDIDRMNHYTLTSPLVLPPLQTIRHTDNVLTAMKWGVEETRDMIMQFYVTLQRMIVQQTVSPKNMMGPVGIFKTGAMFANKGNDWLIWFLAMISANLAVVNFLPIPIVDGGLFVFLIVEKLRGKPVSPGVQTAAQVVGLMLLLSVLVFVTYNDFTR